MSYMATFNSKQKHIMQHETPVGTTDQIKNRLKESSETVKHSVISASDSLRDETCKMCDCTSDAIRQNPIASVVGAAVFGAAVCYLILEGRREPTFGERYINKPLGNATDSVSSSFDSLVNNLKFW